VILNTVRAACVLDYPKDRYRVFVCDDGASIELKKSVADLPYANVFYNARKKGPVKDYKAGNLNANLIYSGSLPAHISSNGSTNFREIFNVKEGFESVSDSMSVPVLKVTDFDASEYVAGLDADMIPEPHWRE
jgi:cellulose synthase/poly-beta-1,6-N-acetylglucosamine synthase-like glycosyltransferase